MVYKDRVFVEDGWLVCGFVSRVLDLHLRILAEWWKGDRVYRGLWVCGLAPLLYNALCERAGVKEVLVWKEFGELYGGNRRFRAVCDVLDGISVVCRECCGKVGRMYEEDGFVVGD